MNNYGYICGKCEQPKDSPGHYYACEVNLEVSKLMENKADLNQMALDCHNISRSKGWLSKERSFGDLIALMHSELSEALEEFREGRGFDEIYYNGKKPEGIPIELADVLIRILQFCGTHEVDIQKAYKIKMEYNATRPHRHGGKVI